MVMMVMSDDGDDVTTGGSGQASDRMGVHVEVWTDDDDVRW